MVELLGIGNSFNNQALLPDKSAIEPSVRPMRFFMSFQDKTNKLLGPLIILLAIAAAITAVRPARGAVVVEKNIAGLAVIKGMVRDDGGLPISDATVAIFRVGTSRLLKQVRSAADGSFIARILPGTYTVLAVADGFNPVTLSEVEVNQSAQLVYGFKLQRAGSGNTLPEKRLDRNNPKWVIRSAQTSRSIYQNNDGSPPVAESTAEMVETAASEEPDKKRAGQSVAETYFAGNENGGYAGVNFATLLPVTENSDIVLAAQVGKGKNAPQRFEAQAKYRPNNLHQINVKSSFGTLGTVATDNYEQSLGQFSFQALDEWKVREGVIVVFGVDYSKFVGAGSDFSLSPRLGLQLDLNSKTRLRSAYTTQTEERTWSKAIELENAQVIFREPAAIEDFVVESGKPLMNKSRRLEFGVERVLDNNSTIEANIFFDTTLGRGVGLMSLPFDSAAGSAFDEFVGKQQGKAQGLRIVYSRRLNGRFSTAAGYSLGSGQKLSAEGISNPANLFQTDYFQSFFGQFDADLMSGTNVKTIFRFSPQATVFAIDPFQGRLAIYDPSLSVLVTQDLPTLGLPFHAQAVVDARNLLDFQAGVAGDEGTLRLNSQRRALRGGILVRF